MYHHFPPAGSSGSHQRLLPNTMTETAYLRAQVQTLSSRVSHLEAENLHLRSLIGVAPPRHPPPPAGHVYQAPPSDNALQLPTVIENLAVLQDHFRRQDTLKQCSKDGCYRYAFSQECFREGHMAWCSTHKRIVTRTYTSCSVSAEERGDCMPVYWEERHDWQEIVDRAYYEGKIGHKSLDPQRLHNLLFALVYAPPNGPPLSLLQGQYPHGNWA